MKKGFSRAVKIRWLNQFLSNKLYMYWSDAKGSICIERTNNILALKQILDFRAYP
jgi:hypothetical protein